MKKASSLPLIFLLTGVVLIAMAFLFSKWLEPETQSPPLAKIERLSGQVLIFRKQLTQKDIISAHGLVHELETIETNPDGEALLDFTNEFRIRILPNSQITLDRNQEKIVLLVKNGDIKVEKRGRENSLFISKEGRRWSASDYEPVLNEDENSKPKLQEKVLLEGLTPSYISMTLTAQKGQFYRCYTQLLQKNPRSTGDATVSITIQPTGKISQSEVTNSNLEDGAFKKCLLEATNRIEFKPFAGDPITTVFPLRFE